MVLTADDTTLSATAAFVQVGESCLAQTRYFSNILFFPPRDSLLVDSVFHMSSQLHIYRTSGLHWVCSTLYFWCLSTVVTHETYGDQNTVPFQIMCFKNNFMVGFLSERIFSDLVPTCEKCNGVVKPDIVFFGENLPSRFFSCIEKDFPKCDLLIILGSSLAVQPFASLIDRYNFCLFKLHRPGCAIIKTVSNR